jgi:hypothetical protein
MEEQRVSPCYLSLIAFYCVFLSLFLFLAGYQFLFSGVEGDDFDSDFKSVEAFYQDEEQVPASVPSAWLTSSPPLLPFGLLLSVLVFARLARPTPPET